MQVNLMTIVLGITVIAAAVYFAFRELGVMHHIINGQRTQLCELKTYLEKLQGEYLCVQRTNRAGTLFMNRMSHDLRTPLNVIVGYSMLMKSHAFEAERTEHYAGRIYLAGLTLLELINEALDSSSIESGKVKLTEDEFGLDSAFEEIKSAIRPVADHRQQDFRFRMTGTGRAETVKGDKQRFCQIFRNLLSNAVKYTPDGGAVDMTVEVTDRGGKLLLVCEIKDTGCGMSKEFVSHIFEPFAREENRQNTSVPGTGLGMCIVKSLTELMNGSISVASELNKGTAVTVKIPLIAVENNDAGRLWDDNENSVLTGMNFLAAEDNESNAEIIREVILSLGALCTVAGDGQKVVKIFEESSADEYDIILMDIQMPVMNGYQAAAAIRNLPHPRAQEIPIIAMTANAFEEDAEQTFACGMNAHVTKPVDLQAFISTVQSLNIKNPLSHSGDAAYIITDKQ